ncbi:class I SAM-dependent methyltransferase [Patescibacteria group bacterium]|nr:class I SAM-dependent methyltransferase [Patescibacteria group bacterium]MBU1759192.1 class I SAM-dependent methyltransferase [Patescibacteria group bacterium]MBU1907046.1 class I SAM-dependent methyltransferase [Patescibacteria group bacterium]
MNEAWVLIIELLMLLLAIGALIFISSVAITSIIGVPFVPTGKKSAQCMFRMAELREGERVADLGCGDGSLLIVAARDFGATGIGYEFNPWLCLLARLRVRLAGVSDRVKIKRANFFKTDLPEADVVACYLLDTVQKDLEPRLIESYPSGTRIVSHGFSSPNLNLIKEEKTKRHRFLLYTIP